MVRRGAVRRPVAKPLKLSDSSRFPGSTGEAEESRLLSGIEVCGRVQGWHAPRPALRSLLSAYLQALGMPQAQVTLRLVGDGVCRSLNRRFRGVDSATDILSFPGFEGRPPKGFNGYLGDLALCLPYAWRKRGRFDPAFSGESAFLLLHGLLHLCGQHHDSPAQEARMWRRSRRLKPLSRPFLKALAALRPVHP